MLLRARCDSEERIWGGTRPRGSRHYWWGGAQHVNRTAGQHHAAVPLAPSRSRLWSTAIMRNSIGSLGVCSTAKEGCIAWLTHLVERFKPRVVVWVRHGRQHLPHQLPRRDALQEVALDKPQHAAGLDGPRRRGEDAVILRVSRRPRGRRLSHEVANGRYNALKRSPLLRMLKRASCNWCLWRDPLQCGAKALCRRRCPKRLRVCARPPHHGPVSITLVEPLRQIYGE